MLSAKHDRQHTELGEVQSRGLFRDLGFSTMFDYATRQLGMSEAEASLRLRLLHRATEVNFLRRSARASHMSMSPTQRGAARDQVHRQSTRAGHDRAGVGPAEPSLPSP